jgi:urease accessory protein UreF
MPRSLQEILDHAEELSRIAEEFEPTDEQLAYGGELAAVYRAVRETTQAEVALAEAVSQAKAAGAPWKAIGAVVGTSGEAARQRYAHLVDGRRVS